MAKVSFNNSQTPFFTSLKEKVNNYFKENNLQTSGNKSLYFKSAIQVIAAAFNYIILVFFTPPHLISILLCIIQGVLLALIGFNLMHEGGHKSFSKHQWLNTIGAYSLNILGGNTFFWKIKHNVNHHTYTNIEGVDSDIDINPFMRLNLNQKRRWFHKFQHYYCLFLYGLSYLVWIFWDDFQKYFTGKIAPGYQKKLDKKEHIVFWITKIYFVIIYLIIPMTLIGIVKALLGFLLIAFTTGLSIAIVFQLAHVVEGTDFLDLKGDSGRIEQEWAIHQINTTANFSTKNKVITWLLGGLNFQVEHHLFPKISHVHYPKINEFVKETCLQYQVSYKEQDSFFKAIQSHFSHIRKMGITETGELWNVNKNNIINE